jgi:phosphate uptake regulator
MLKELMAIFRGTEPLEELRTEFTTMFQLAHENALEAGLSVFEDSLDPAARSKLYSQDIEINQSECRIRKILVAHLALPGNHVDAPYALLMMNVVKDVERLGDYAKNLLEVRDLFEGTLPDDERVAELKDIRLHVDQIFTQTLDIFNESNGPQAIRYVQEGRSLGHRCDVLLTKIAQSDCNASITTALVLTTRYYKRLVGHLGNILSGVVMPLHKVDYFDEEAMASGTADAHEIADKAS